MNISKRRIIMKAFLKSHFRYCCLVWMCHNRTNHSKINKLHKRCLRITHSDKTLSFESLLGKDGSASIHNRNLQLLAVEMYKGSKGLSPSFITGLFKNRNEHQFNLRHSSHFNILDVNSVYHGLKTFHSWVLKFGRFYQMV